MYDIFYFPGVKEEIEKKFSKDERKQIDSVIKKNLQRNPIHYGDPIAYSYFREFKIESKRIYFLVYQNFCLVLLVATSKKKDQQTTIDDIKKLIPMFKEYAQKLYEENSKD